MKIGGALLRLLGEKLGFLLRLRDDGGRVGPACLRLPRTSEQRLRLRRAASSASASSFFTPSMRASSAPTILPCTRNRRARDEEQKANGYEMFGFEKHGLRPS